MASWRDAGREKARLELGVTSNTQIGRSGRASTLSSTDHEPSETSDACAIVVEKLAYRNVTLLMTHYDRKEQLGLLWDEVGGRLSSTQEDFSAPNRAPISYRLRVWQSYGCEPDATRWLAGPLSHRCTFQQRRAGAD